MKIINAVNKEDLMRKIETINANDKEVYISLRPTLEIVFKILEKNPGLKKISCPQSLYLQVSKKVFKFLNGRGIEITPGEFTAGRPPKYDDETIAQIISKRRNGNTAKQISEEMNIPLRTVYFYLKKEKI